MRCWFEIRNLQVKKVFLHRNYFFIEKSNDLIAISIWFMIYGQSNFIKWLLNFSQTSLHKKRER